MKKTHNDGLRKQKNCGVNTNGGKRKPKADLTGLLGQLEFIRLARKEIERLDSQYLDLKRECARLDRDIVKIGHRIMEVLQPNQGKRSASEMQIRLKGARLEQFREALRYKSLHPTRNMYGIARMVFTPPPPKGDRRGYPTWRSLYRYMSEMNRKYGCFE